MNPWEPSATRDALIARARLNRYIREFFAQREVLEVETPLLARFTVTDPAIDPLIVATAQADQKQRYLQTSPEFAMKRLLAAGSGPIYQLGKAFRDGERGARHNPEFTMLEWYRPGFSNEQLMKEVSVLIDGSLGPSDYQYLSYRQVFIEATGVDVCALSSADLESTINQELLPAASTANLELDQDGWLDLLLTHRVQPWLKKLGRVFIHDFPPTQAALAKVGSTNTAQRFELYVDGVELANGYQELLDPEILELRALEDNKKRSQHGRPARELDPRLQQAMRSGLPACAGVALGVDRLLMLALGLSSLSQVLAFDWDRA
ncbi:MAG: EF-P lysine aminoacylase EpmA [Pseudomonadota bacterium]